MKTILIFLLTVSVAAGANPHKKLAKLLGQKKYDKVLVYCENTNKLSSEEKAGYLMAAQVKLYKKTPSEALWGQLMTNAAGTDDSALKLLPIKSGYNECKKVLLNKAYTAYKKNDTAEINRLAKWSLEIYTDSVIHKKYLIKKETTSATVASKKEEEKKGYNRDSLIAYAEKYLGKPYKWAGAGPNAFDCSGYTQFVMKKAGVELLHFAKEQSEAGELIATQKVQKGDLVFFGKRYSNGRCKIDHVGIYHSMQNGNPCIIHCASNGIVIQEMKPGEYWSKKILFYKDVLTASDVNNFITSN